MHTDPLRACVMALGRCLLAGALLAPASPARAEEEVPASGEATESTLAPDDAKNPDDERLPASGQAEPVPKHLPETFPNLKLTTIGQGAKLSEVVVEARRPLSAASSAETNYEDFELRPHSTTQEILNNIPGLVVAQHQGGGKATQYLIRGFDADHGTDFAVFVDDLPVNLVSHAHGQGYADLNFLIPDTVETLRLWKGPYFAHLGDFAVAGALNLVTKDEVAENYVRAEGGSFGTQRYVAMLSPKLGDFKTLIAGQAYYTNGPFINPQNYARYNFFSKLTFDPTPDTRMRVSTGFYQGDWDGSGQIPLRAVDGRYPDGQPFTGPLISRFGSIDPTEGGKTDRENVNVQFDWSPSAQEKVSAQIYGSHYKLRLWSDFTFFRDTGFRFIQEPNGDVTDTGDGPVIPNANYIPGDQIQQNDRRYLWGERARYSRYWDLGFIPVQSEIGFENRNDDIDLALNRSVRRKNFYAINKLAVFESSVSGWMRHEFLLNDWIRFETGLRGDVFFFNGRNRLPQQAPDPNFDPVLIQGYEVKSIVSPKANLILTPIQDTDVYMNFGTGFHSNDARNALLGQSTGFNPLTRAIGAELGTRTHQLDRLDASAALWWLDLDSELVFSGDAGNQETGAGGTFQPAGATRRWGIDFETRYAFTDWLTFDYDLSWDDPQFRSSGLAIPLAPTLLMNTGLTARFDNGFSVALRSRFLGDRPATEDRSLTAQGYFLLDLLAQYRWRNVELSLALLNLTDTDWREAQFADQTCVRSEVGSAQGCLAKPGKQGSNPVTPVDDIHFTPGNPFAVRGGLQIYF